MNEKMRRSIGGRNPADFAKGTKLNQKLSRLLASGFFDVSGAIVFTAMRKLAETVKPENFSDLTGFECFVNHIHVEDHLNGSDQGSLLKQGVTFGLAIEGQLRSTVPDKAFKVIVAATANGCGVRFHLVRSGEEWLASNLDAYQGEAILVLEDHSIVADRQ
jgi:hypothetical protein